jgi:prepilin-type N-terminal cleavage/methylation domain-containing protein
MHFEVFMTRIHRTTQRRPAFTLVELLVAMALILFIMVILSEAFVQGLSSFRELKAVGDMEEKLRSATMILRRDLAADHFEGRRRLSDPNFWVQGPPREGFFDLYQGACSYLEGRDSDGNPSYRAPNLNPLRGTRPPNEVPGHFLYFTVKQRGNNVDRYFSANVPPPPGSPLLTAPTNFFGQPPDANFQDPNSSTFNSPWAEVCYFLDTRPQSQTMAGTTPLYPLYRTQLVVAPDTRQVNAANIPRGMIGQYLEMSCNLSTNSILFHNPNDLAQNVRSLTPQFLSSASSSKDPTDPLSRLNKGTTLLLTDVISFDVRVLKYIWPNRTAIGLPMQLEDFQDANPFALDPNLTKKGKLRLYNLDNPADPGWAYNSTYPWFFSTSIAYDLQKDPLVPLPAGTSVPPPQFCISALAITIRVWDAKTEQARQVTIIQDM